MTFDLSEANDVTKFELPGNVMQGSTRQELHTLTNENERYVMTLKDISMVVNLHYNKCTVTNENECYIVILIDIAMVVNLHYNALKQMKMSVTQ